MFKKELIKEIKKTFFPYKGIDNMEKRIEENFLIDDIKSFKKHGKKMIYVNSRSTPLIFIYEKDSLNILLITDSNCGIDRIGSVYIEGKSTTKIDILSSKEWELDNIRTISIISSISENSSNIIYNFTEEGISKFDTDLLHSPAIWFLNRTGQKMISASKSKTKFSFISNTIKLIININSNKQDIFSKDFKPLKEKIFSSMLRGLLSNKSRSYSYNDILNQRNKLFADTIFPNLFSTVKYNEDVWNLYFETELIPSLKEEFLDYLFNFDANSDETERKNINNTLANNLIPDTNKNRFPIQLSVLGFINNFSDIERANLFEEFSQFIDEILPLNLLKNNFNKKETTIPTFNPTILEVVRKERTVQEEYRKATKLSDNNGRGVNRLVAMRAS